MATQVEIFNAALIDLGAATITDPNEQGEKPDLLRRRYPSILDTVLRAHPWNFALDRATLPADGVAPKWGFARQFSMPTDPWCLRVLETDQPDFPFKPEGRKILTDAGAPLNISFIKRVTDPTVFDALFVEALAARLAHAIAYKVTGSTEVVQEMWQLYTSLVPEARSIDAQEGTPDDLVEDEILDSRF